MRVMRAAVAVTLLLGFLAAWVGLALWDRLREGRW